MISQIKLPRLISNGMVLQRNEKVKIWGWASPKEMIKLEFKSSSKWYNNLAAANLFSYEGLSSTTFR
ncbi:hypothetical protein [Flavobacterium limnophilum]|uniref:hypothetical protein n=1 Tax=Flavobacterium limnophilum TaxID=3003262 RepID=UPI0022AC4D5F|nr:hypothetical protein [Flavobacterium limnophilum]